MSEWRDIETAPTEEETVVLLYCSCNDGGWFTQIVVERRGDWWIEVCYGDLLPGYFTPTHWMPLPPPPTQGNGG